MPRDVDDQTLKTAAKAAEAGTPLEHIWEWVNRPLVGAENALIPGTEHSHSEDESTMRRVGEDLGASLTSPVSLATMATGYGAARAGRAGMLGISQGARVLEAGLQAPFAVEGVGNILNGDSTGQRLGGVVQAGLAAHGVNSAMTHAFDPKAVVAEYTRERGMAPHAPEPFVPANSMKTADNYAAMPHAPNDPAVAASYQSLRNEIKQQYLYLRDRAGLNIEASRKNYPTSAAMVDDVQKNNHLNFFPTEAGFGEDAAPSDHPMLQVDPDTGMTFNDMFRAVHDYFGHASEGNSFGPKGEQAAFNAHRNTLTPGAHGALASETKGQNSVVNFGPHMRDQQGALLPKDLAPRPQDRPFAEQKTGLLPEYAPAGPKGVFGDVLERHASGGGSTTDIRTGRPIGSQDARYIGSPYKERSLVLDHAPTEQELGAYTTKNQDLLSQDGHYFGTWLNPEDQKHYLDVVVGENDLNAAHRRFAKEHAFFDTVAGKDVPVMAADAVGSSPSRTAPDAAPPAPPATADGPRLRQLEHRSRQAGLTELDPGRYGTGAAGAELKRQKAYPQDFVPRTYYTNRGGKAENFRFGPHLYDAEIPEDKLYDIGTDSQGIVAKVREANKGNGAQSATLMERAVKDAGFLGYFDSTAENPTMRDTVAAFEKLPVKARAEQVVSDDAVLPKEPLSFDKGADKAAHKKLMDGMASLSDEDIRKLDSVDDFGKPLSKGDRGLDKSGNKLYALAGPATALYPGKFSDDEETDTRIRKYLAVAGVAGAIGAAASFPKDLQVKLDAVKHATIQGFKERGETIRDSVVKSNVRKTLRSLVDDPKEQKFLEGLYHTIPLPKYEGINFDTRKPINELVKGRDGNFAFKNFTSRRLDTLYDVGHQQGAHWGNPDWIKKLVGGEPELAAKFARTLGALSPGTPTGWNAAQGAEVFIRHVLNGEPLGTVLGSMETFGVQNRRSKELNLIRAAAGGRIFGEKTENLAASELGVKGRIPIDMWLLRAFGSHTDKTPGPKLYRVFEDAFTRYAESKGEDPFTVMAKVWTGMQKVAKAETPSWQKAFETMGLTGDLTNEEYRSWAAKNLPTLTKRLLAFDSQQKFADDLQQVSLPPKTKSRPNRTFGRDTERHMLQTQYEGDVLNKHKMTKVNRQRLEAILTKAGVPLGDDVPF